MNEPESSPKADPPPRGEPDGATEQPERATWQEELGTVPGLVRLGLGMAWRTTRWSAETYARALGSALGAGRSSESAGELLEEASRELRDGVRDVLTVAGLADRREPGATRERPGGAEADPPSARRGRGRRGRAGDRDELRAKGADLLARSMLPETDELSAHPAYGRILELLSPDEARILRLLAASGPQPSVDVRTWRPFGIGAEQTGTGLSLIGEEAGCRYPDHVPAYLNNLFRLGLIWFSREKLREPAAYQVIEAQPDVNEAIEQAGGRAKVVRRSIRLTPFGADFCATCIPPPGDYMELGITTEGGPRSS